MKTRNIISLLFLISTAFCLVHFLSKLAPIENLTVGDYCAFSGLIVVFAILVTMMTTLGGERDRLSEDLRLLRQQVEIEKERESHYQHVLMEEFAAKGVTEDAENFYIVKPDNHDLCLFKTHFDKHGRPEAGDKIRVFYKELEILGLLVNGHAIIEPPVYEVGNTMTVVCKK